MNHKARIKATLFILGVKGAVRIRPASVDRYEVTVSGKYFGIWDAQRETWVD